MFIRKSPIKNKKTGGCYYSFRLVESVRVDSKVKQKTLLNLGKHFDVDSAHWNLLANRIDQIIHGTGESQQNLFCLNDAIDMDLETMAQRYAALVLQKLSSPVLTGTSIGDSCSVPS